jgi:predicted PurR-regulated permease PerM
LITLRNQVLIWIGFLVISVLVLWVFRGILLPFIVGLALAYLLNPLVGYLQRIGLNRGWSTNGSGQSARRNWKPVLPTRLTTCRR